MDSNDIERTARRRAGAKLGWFIHAMAYVAVNALLATIAAMSGRDWAIFPLLGWGLGLAIHGAVVFFATGGAGLYDGMVRRERERLQLQRDPW